MAYYLSTDGVDDFIVSPSMTYTIFEMDFTPIVLNNNCYFDALGTMTLERWSGFDDIYGSGNGTVYKDGVAQTSHSVMFTQNQRATLRVVMNTAKTGSVEFMRGFGGEYMKGNIYSIKFYNGASLVASYDMSTQTVQDQTGNGRHATLTGGTWIDEGGGSSVAGGGTLTGTGTLTATGRNNISKGATLSGTGSLTATGQNNISGTASLSGSGSLSATGTNLISGRASLSGTSSFSAAGTASSPSVISGGATLNGTGSLTASGSLSISGGAILTGSGSLSIIQLISGGATLTGSGSLTASGIAGCMVLRKLRFQGERQTKLNFTGLRALNINFQGERQTKISFKGGLPLAKKEQNATHTAGDSVDLIFTVTDADTGLTANLSGATAIWGLKQSETGNSLITKSGTIGSGTVTVSLSPSDTSGLKAGRYYHEAQVTDPLGKVSTITKGWITIEPNAV